MSCNACHNPGTGRWIVGCLLALIAMAGLFLSAHTAGGGFYLHGLALFAICAVWIFRLIDHAYDGSDDRHTRHP
ncbi:MAG: hypothetical protein HYU57_00920 [Micavibrio aeruginosavorus]|nr:hypothetical protein [Micavibrio aeruginosavorus]